MQKNSIFKSPTRETYRQIKNELQQGNFQIIKKQKVPGAPKPGRYDTDKYASLASYLIKPMRSNQHESLVDVMRRGCIIIEGYQAELLNFRQEHALLLKSGGEFLGVAAGVFIASAYLLPALGVAPLLGPIATACIIGTLATVGIGLIGIYFLGLSVVTKASRQEAQEYMAYRDAADRLLAARSVWHAYKTKRKDDGEHNSQEVRPDEDMPMNYGRPVKQFIKSINTQTNFAQFNANIAKIEYFLPYRLNQCANYSDSGGTALMVAVKCGNVELVRNILKYADPDLRYLVNGGKNAVDMAQEIDAAKRRKDMLAILKAAP